MDTQWQATVERVDGVRFLFVIGSLPVVLDALAATLASVDRDLLGTQPRVTLEPR